MSYKSFPHSNVSVRIATEQGIKGTAKREKKSSKQKAKDSMQPCNELAAIFGVCKVPTIKRSKL